MEDDLSELCEAYYEYTPGLIEPGSSSTYVNVGEFPYKVNSSAKLALDLYYRQTGKKFHLVQVCKLNYGVRYDGLIFCAQEDESGERRLFRGVFGCSDEVLFCEIKYDAVNSNLVDDVDEYLQKLNKRDEDLPSDTSYNKDDLGDCSVPGSDGAILVAPTMFRIMGEKSFSALHMKCDDYLDPCLYEKCPLLIVQDVRCFPRVKADAESAIKFYNRKEQKNFIFVDVERFYSFCYRNGYCMTFWAKNGSEEFRLFRAVLPLKDGIEVSPDTDQSGAQNSWENISDLTDDDDDSTGLSRTLLMQELECSKTASRSYSAYETPGLDAAVLSIPAVTGPSTDVGFPCECLLQKNMFDHPQSEAEREFDLKEYVEDECSKFGKLQQIYVDKNSAGCVYVWFENTESSTAALQALHGRWFAGRMITASFSLGL